MMWAITKMCW